MKKPTLWTKNFTIITLGTVISGIGYVAMGIALSFVVFDHTGSTLMSALFVAVSMLPQMVLPVLVSPYLDNFRRKPVIVGLDYTMGILYLLFGWYLLKNPFELWLYLAASLVFGSIGAVYSLAYQSLYPNLIPEGFAQKGYTVSGMLYPTISVVFGPLGAFLYDRVGLAPLCLGVGVMLLIAATVETQIRVEERTKKGTHFSLREYWQDFKDGLGYLRREKGLLRIYSFMSINQGVGDATGNLIKAWFRVTPGLGITLFAFLSTAQFAGRTLGGLFHYKVEIPPEKRFSLTFFVYMTYQLMDTILLWLGYPLMLLDQAVCGFLGINSATLRESSVQKYIPDQMRAKVNAVSGSFMALVPSLFTVAVGALGEVMDYRLCVTLVSLLSFVPIYFIIWRGREDIKKIYNQAY